jgi:hypothetical protein
MNGSAVSSLLAPIPSRPAAARTRMVLEAPIVPTRARCLRDNCIDCGRANRFKFKRHMKALLLLIPIAALGCGPAPQMDTAQQQIAAPWAGREDTLRVRVDRKRERVWVLTLDSVDVYDSRRRSLVRRILLPAWSVADSIGAPDMVLDRSGAAIISHNVEPRFWEIDGTSFTLREHEVRLLESENLALGFSTLTLAHDRTLVAVDSSAGTLWRIDLRGASAQRLPSRAPDGCALAC